MNHITELQKELTIGEGFLIESPSGRRYLTGFPSSAGIVVITCEDACFFTDFRYFEKAANTVRCCRVKQLTGLGCEVKAFCEAQGIHTLHLERDFVTLQRLEQYRIALPGMEMVGDDLLSRALWRLRSIKKPWELSCIRAAQALTDQTFSYIAERIAPGRTEREIQLDMEFFLRRAGSEEVAFDFVVVSGKNTSLPHGVPSDKPVEQGDFVTMDFGGVIGGYRSDMTRTVAVGTISSEAKRIYDIVLAAKRAAMAAIRPGAVCKEIDRIARNLISRAGYKGCFGHGLGHSVGLDIHEEPSFNTRCETLLSPGMVITVEPGIYLENQFGVRVEDMIVVTENGYENLTHSTDELLIV